MPKRGISQTATSEVGSNPPPSDMQQMWREFFAEQSSNFIEMMRMMRVPDLNAHRTIPLPKFNADSTEADASAWCTMVDMVIADKPLEGSALLLALSGALLGDASQWLTQSWFPGITWSQFKEMFLQRFGSSETTAATVMTWWNSRPKTGESISAYGNRLVNSLESKWKKMNVEEIAVSVALAHITKIDARLQRLVFTTEIKTRADLQHELKAYSYSVDKQHLASGNCVPKKMKFSPVIKCHFCGKEGHKIAECRSRRESFNVNRRSSPKSASSPKDKITCFKCGVASHIASACPKRVTPAEGKRVDVCQIIEPRGTLVHAGEFIPFFF